MTFCILNEFYCDGELADSCVLCLHVITGLKYANKLKNCLIYTHTGRVNRYLSGLQIVQQVNLCFF